MKAITGESQHSQVVKHIDRKKIKKVERKTCIERREISLLKGKALGNGLKENKLKY